MRSVLLCCLVAILLLTLAACVPEIKIPEVPTVTSPTTPVAPGTATATPTATAPAAPSLAGLVKISGSLIPGSEITLNASPLSEKFGTDLRYSWQQLFLPDKYDGLQYVSGNRIRIDGADQSSVSFTPEWPGNYRINLKITGTGVDESLDVDVMVKPPESPFEIRGIAYGMWHYSPEVAYLSEGFAKRAKESGANLIMLSPTWYMSSPTANEMSPCPLDSANPEICRGNIEDEALIKMIREAKAQGLDVMIKMILNLTGPDGPEWPDIHPASWDEWFDNWTDVCLHYAEICEREGAGYYAVGSELRTTVEQTDHWRQLIQKVREVYSGYLTYGDNALSYGEWGHFQVWDEMDYIGIHLYGAATGEYGVPQKTDPTVDEMASVIDARLKEYLDPMYEKFQKPVIFLEFSTDSYDGSNIDHFEYDPSKAVDNAEQSEYYEAGLRVLASRDYVAGVNIWCYTWITYDASRLVNQSPIGKPAEQVLKLWFGAIC